METRAWQVLDELKAAGLDDENARGVAQIVAPYGAIEFGKFIDRSATLSTLGVKEIAAAVTSMESKKHGAESVPALRATPSV